MLILLPPSESKAVPRRGRPLDLTNLSFSELTGARGRVLDALVSLTGRDDAADVLGIGATQSDLVALDARLRTSPTVRAELLYSVLYDALGLTTLKPAAHRRATTRTAVVSSLFGLVRPGDRLPSYRLSGDVNLPGLGSVAGGVARGPRAGRP